MHSFTGKSFKAQKLEKILHKVISWEKKKNLHILQLWFTPLIGDRGKLFVYLRYKELKHCNKVLGRP